MNDYIYVLSDSCFLHRGGGRAVPKFDSRTISHTNHRSSCNKYVGASLVNQTASRKDQLWGTEGGVQIFQNSLLFFAPGVLIIFFFYLKRPERSFRS